jgi:enamine deaminase RidA (YjgF/YER057c/UK114 family)
MRIKNARQFVALAEECGYTKAEIRRMTGWVDDHQETIITLVQSGKIQSAEMLDDNPNMKNEKQDE